jgi:hypothetical protein
MDEKSQSHTGEGPVRAEADGEVIMAWCRSALLVGLQGLVYLKIHGIFSLPRG